ncbi:MAG: amidohydrolase family protein [Pseudodesulfovibrio sp.]|nr:amidohydrolase family protein [Pseudomonadota bacterium]MBV1766399.1 amidohydrolase family protein [Pseudodesulfovibrio sp.]MBU4245113.1 amidohydrolase family protein [Pseudomonadota bacterium]MBU4378968.1 amidohydrolase family protein [Pseudomonadota bacterium]MBU4474289.1 amidohydrolase family protein [Pseudomonadota bacterium]
MAVLVAHGRIEAILAATDPDRARAVASVPVLAVPGATILPGIVNCHVHGLHASNERRERYLVNGVTSIGDAASPLSALPLLLDSPSGRTATAACAGPMLCPPGGYPLTVHSPDHGLTVASPHQARERVRQLADAGVNTVKFAFEPGPNVRPWPLFDAATARAICDEARRLGLTTRCHVEDCGGLEPALDAGAQTVEHVPHRWITANGPCPVLTAGEHPEPVPHLLRLLERMAREKIIMTPTLDVLTRSLWNGPALFATVRAFAAMGGRIALGNDHPYRRTGAGMPLREMDLLRQAGLTMTAIIGAATRTSALACNLADRGAIEPGMAADLLLVRGDLAAGLHPLAAPLCVIKDGRIAAPLAGQG